MKNILIVAVLLIFTLSAHAQIDRKFIYNTWQDMNKYYGDTMKFVPVSTLYPDFDKSKTHPEYANKVVRFVQFTTDNRMIDFDINLTTGDTVKYNLRATWEFNNDIYEPKLLITGRNSDASLKFV